MANPLFTLLAWVFRVLALLLPEAIFVGHGIWLLTTEHRGLGIAIIVMIASGYTFLTAVVLSSRRRAGA